MARHPRNEMAVSQLGTAVAKLVKKHPATTAKDIERWGWVNLTVDVGAESIRKALKGDIDPSQCAVELLMLLAGYFAVDPSALGHIAEARLRPFLLYAGSVNGPDTPPGLEVSGRACNGDVLRFRARRSNAPAVVQSAQPLAS